MDDRSCGFKNSIIAALAESDVIRIRRFSKADSLDECHHCSMLDIANDAITNVFAGNVTTNHVGNVSPKFDTLHATERSEERRDGGKYNNFVAVRHICAVYKITTLMNLTIRNCYKTP